MPYTERQVASAYCDRGGCTESVTIDSSASPEEQERGRADLQTRWLVIIKDGQQHAFLCSANCAILWLETEKQRGHLA